MSTTGERRSSAPHVFYSPEVIDLCAGPGGWDEGIYSLGIHPLGIEIDDMACRTATIAGHARVQGDISKIDPKVYAGATGLIASPPCQGFSMAGKGDGRRDAELLLKTIRDDFAIDPSASIAALHEHMHDDRSVLVLEPLRWALALLPSWIALEQVPTVLPIWEAVAEVLREHGYSVETGICSSEEYGVPQTRERAILVARDAEMTDRLGPAQLAPATHSYYHRRDPRKLDEGVLPWVSMAQALAWGMTERPYFTIAAGTAQGGADAAMLGGSGARASLGREIEAGRWKQRSNYSGPGKPGETAAERGLGTRDSDLPSFAVTTKAFHWVPDEDGSVSRDEVGIVGQRRNSGPGAERDPRSIHSPSYTVRAQGSGSHPSGVEWVPDADATVKTGNFSAKTRDADGERSAAGSVPFERSIDAPAPTVTGNVRAWEVGPGTEIEFVQGNQAHATRRDLDQPAPTITGGHDYGERRWQMSSAGATARFTAGQVPRDLDVPSATITGKGTAYWTKEGLTAEEAPRGLPDWTHDRPATTVQGDPRIAAPGHRHPGPDCCNAGESESQFDTVPHVGWLPTGLADNPKASGVRVTVQEAAILQSFPHDYPWQGNKGDQYRQVGDAVPPLMARAIVQAVTTLDTTGR